MNKNSKGPAEGIGRGRGTCNPWFRLWKQLARDPFIWLSFLKGLIVGGLLGWWLL